LTASRANLINSFAEILVLDLLDGQSNADDDNDDVYVLQYLKFYFSM